jgi:Domain of unknown function (DUF4091)
MTVEKRRNSGAARSAIVLCLVLCACLRYARPADAGAASAAKVWIETSLHRVFPTSPEGTMTELNLISERNHKISFQACLRDKTNKKLHVLCSTSGSSDLKVTIRRVGYVPMPHRTTDVPDSEEDGIGFIPGLVPDPLFPEHEADIGPGENQSFWITVQVPADIAPGPRELKVSLESEDAKTKAKVMLGDITAHIDVRPLQIQPRHGFPVTHWWHPDALYDYYKTEPFSEKWWQMAELYLRDMTSHGSNMIMVPIFHTRREVVPRPPQLLKVKEVSPGKYDFDFSDVHRFILTAKRSGMEYFEFPHLWLYWGVRNPVHVYQLRDGKWELLWPTDSDATTGVFRGFLEQYLPALRKFLDSESLPADHCFFHVSDEPGSGEQFENYKRARQLLKELAPWMQVMDALSDIQYGKQGVTDYPVPILSSAQKYIDSGIPHWVYFCTGPREAYLNRLFDTPLPKVRMSGFLFYKLRAKGFLHWGYNYWYKMDTQQLENVFEEGAGGAWPGIPYGDPFEVYPGENGPIDSIRWEVFSESLEDYAILQSAGISPDSPLLTDVRNYQEFPKTADWIDRTVRQILSSTK